jgi:hypothetical protein
MTRAAKPAVVAVFTLLWLVVSVQRVPDGIGKYSEIGVDTSWVVALPEMLHQHAISGRDFHFTYGPLAQVLAYVGASLHSPWSANDSLPLIMLAFYAASVFLFAAILLLLRPMRWKHCVLLYVAIAALNLFSEPTAFRPLALVLCTVLFIHAIHSNSVPRIVAWSALTGVACFAAQLLTFELGPYAIATIVIAGVAIAVRQKLKARLWLCLSVLFAVYGIGNLATDLVFYVSGSSYAFFDYQRYAIETIRGFTFSQSLPWELGVWPTLGLFAVGLSAAGVMFVIDRKEGESDLFLALLVCSFVELKSLTIRSDIGHITQSFSPLVLVFLLGSAVYLSRWRVSKAPTILWGASLVVLWFSWPWAGNYFAADLFHAATNKSPITKLSSIRHVSSEPVADTSSNPLLAFPYQNYIPIAMRHPVVAPVLMSYNASTETLQKYYVESLDREKALEVVYGVDSIDSKTIDEVQAVSRTPLIFDYLYQHFRLGGKAPILEGYYLLRRDTESPRQLVSTDVKQSGPAECNLLRLNLEMDYPFSRHVGRPTPIELLFSKNGTPILKTTLVALKANEPFSTYVSLIPPDHFHDLFRSGPIAPTSWDKMEVTTRTSDWLGVAPSKVDVRRIECLLAQ